MMNALKDQPQLADRIRFNKVIMEISVIGKHISYTKVFSTKILLLYKMYLEVYIRREQMWNC